jgi:hypothetical protein
MEEKKLDVTQTNQVNDIKVFGNPDLWQLICKGSSESQGWMKSTKAMQIGNNVVIQTTTQQKVISYVITDSSTTVENAKIVEDKDESGKVIGRRVVEN